MKDEVKNLYDYINLLDNMLTSLAELLEDKGILIQEEWKKRIREKRRGR